jgi:N-acetylglutamate synthase-like GNAT family acetyltransferase
MNLLFKTPTNKEFEAVCLFITQYELDSRNLQKQQFTIALRDNEMVGFGRLLEHSDCLELCSLGVMTTHRNQHIGKAIVEELIKHSVKNIYLVCIIPDFFKPFGFIVVQRFPKSIQNKMDYCTRELVVPETYVAMVLDVI